MVWRRPTSDFVGSQRATRSGSEVRHARARVSHAASQAAVAQSAAAQTRSLRFARRPVAGQRASRCDAWHSIRLCAPLLACTHAGRPGIALTRGDRAGACRRRGRRRSPGCWRPARPRSARRRDRRRLQRAERCQAARLAGGATFAARSPANLDPSDGATRLLADPVTLLRRPATTWLVALASTTCR